MRNIQLILVLVVGFAIQGYSQTKKAYIEAAEEAYASKNYYGALKWFGEALEFDHDNVDLIFKYAESARKFQAYDLAAEKYQLLVDSLAVDVYPEASLHLGEMLQKLGKYEDSKKYYNLYLSEYSASDSLNTSSPDNSANQAIEAIDYALVLLENPDKSANISELESDVNTPYSEFGAIKKDDILYFSTMRYAEKDPEDLPARGISKIHTLSESEEGETNLPIEGDLNETDQLVGNTTFSLDGQLMYYTLCDYINGEDVHCDIYSREVNEDGTFGDKILLPASINMDSVTNTQPQVSYDSLLNAEVLYFVSDRKGGIGKLDIYRSVILGPNIFGEVANLIEINTEENETTPFYHTATSTLYFSTDGRKGLGGYDIFSSIQNKNQWLEAEIVKPPVNSSYHDLYYVVDDIEEEAYFSSNRETAMYIDPAQKACCFDIFKVNYDEVIIEMDALVFDDFTKDSLLGATLNLLDVETGDTIKSLTNMDGNDFYFKLRRDKEYQLIATRPYYNTVTMPLSTVNISKSTSFKEEIFMTTDMMQLEVFTFNERTKGPLAGVNITIKNLTTGKIDTVALNELGNNYHFYLDLGNKYEIEATKFGFVTETEIVDLTDVSDPGLISKKMYLEVFDIEDYMPVSVYFENDQPDPRSKSTSTDIAYGDLYAEYINNKDKHIKNRTKRLNSDSRAEAVQYLDGFFEGDVVGGYDKLRRFMRALKKELELGRNLEIAIKGYTSPIADTRYNLALGQRRVQCIKNEILRYENGVFRNYVADGRLILTDISFGEETSPTHVSDSVSDKKNSVYSVEAGKERRVEIVKITDQ